MINIDEILKMWEADCEIDNVQLDDSSRKFAKVHSKYLTLLTESKLLAKRLEMQLADLKRDKFLYYNGKMTKEQMDAKGWPYDPFNGMSKPLRGDMDMFYESDTDIQRLNGKIDYQKTINEALEEIMNTLRWRHAVVKNIIDYRKFTSGA